MNKNVKIVIDFETRSRLDLKKVGATKYTKHKSTRPLCLAFKIEGKKDVDLWTPHTHRYDPSVIDLHDLIRDGATIQAWNALFDFLVWNNIMVARYGWPLLKLRQMDDLMARAAVHGYPLGLDNYCEAVGMQGKDRKGKMLISKLSKPVRNQGRDFIEYHNDPKLFQDMYTYCKNDVVITALATKHLPELTPREKDYWTHTAMMNIRGIPVDREELDAINLTVMQEISRQNSKVPFLTDGEIDKVSQVKALKKWIEKDSKCTLPGLSKQAVQTALDCFKLTSESRELLKIRQRVGLTSNAKFKRALEMELDGRIHDCFQYYGAHTGRLSGRGLQLQNLLRAKIDEHEADTIFRMLKLGGYEAASLIYGKNLLEKLSKLCRAIIKAPDGMKFICADFSSIEAIATPWVAGEYQLIDKIAKGLDQYKVMASNMFNVDYDDVTDEQRQIGKIVILACGYAGGYRALLGMAENYGIELDEDAAKHYVKLFRMARKNLTYTWSAFGHAAMESVCTPGREILVKLYGSARLFFLFDKRYLRLKLPSGRELFYPDAVLDLTTRYGENLMVSIRDKVMSLSGANFFQNAVQAICRDLLMEAQMNLEIAGYPIIMSIHDECVSEVPDSPKYNLENFIKIMTKQPVWARGMVIKADGWEGYRYRK